MHQLYVEALQLMEESLEVLEKSVPQPQRKPLMDGFVYRYVEKSVHQAIIQKLARVVSGLHAARILMEHGFFQEQAALQRMLDEFREDITFLSYALTVDKVTELHKEYLAAFYEEEFDNPDDPVKSTQRRPMIPRKKIRAYISRVEGKLLNSSREIELSRTISKTYSGFVHGASSQIMDMYGGYPPRFHVSGMLGTPREKDYRDDLWNYFYRGILAFALSALAFKNNALLSKIIRYRDYFERESDKSSSASTNSET